MRWPVRNQILLPVLAVSLASVAVIGGANAWFAYTAARGAVVARAQGVADVLSHSSFPLTPPVLRQMSDLSGAHFVLTSADGVPQATSLASPPAEMPSDRPVGTPEEITLRDTLAVDGRPHLHAALRMPSRAGVASDQLLHVLFPLSEYQRALWSAVAPPLVVGGLSLGAVVLVVSAIAQRIGGATARLGVEVGRLAEGDYQAIAEPQHNDELADLCRAVNRTAERLAVYEQEVRGAERAKTLAVLAAGLAHEMRNAATGCRMAIDLHAESCGQGQDESLDVARRQLRLIESQLQRYLRLGEGSAETRDEEVELDGLVAAALPLAAPSADHAGTRIEWTPGAPSVTLRVDCEAVTQVVINLLQNALEATAAQAASGGPAGVVSVGSEAADGCWRLTVVDNGAGPDPELADAIFEPFVTSKPEGVGLGLALSQQATQRHGGQLTWRREAGRTRFELSLPLAT